SRRRRRSSTKLSRQSIILIRQAPMTRERCTKAWWRPIKFWRTYEHGCCEVARQHQGLLSSPRRRADGPLQERRPFPRLGREAPATEVLLLGLRHPRCDGPSFDSEGEQPEHPAHPQDSLTSSQVPHRIVRARA